MTKVFESKSTEVAKISGDFESNAGGSPWGQLPEKVNPQIPDAAWLLMQDAARLAVSHLHYLLQPHMFRKLTPKEQVMMIKLATDRAYGSNDAAIRRTILPPPGVNDVAFSNELHNLSRRASRDLPEFQGKRSPSEGSERVVPLRRSGRTSTD